MSNLNQVILQGNLTDNPQLMGEEKNVARFTIAVNNGFGERRTTTFVDCVAFGNQAPVIAQHLSKGKQAIVRGTLIQNRWEDKETGSPRSKLEVRLENVNGFFFTGNAGGAAAEEASGEPVAATENSGGGEGEGNLF